MKRLLALLIGILFLFSLSYCKTTPPPEPEKTVEQQPEPEPEVQPQPEPEPEPEPEVQPQPEPEPQVEPVSEETIKLAQDALDRAERAEAGTYAPELYNSASKSFQEALAVKESDPDKSRELLAQTKTEADNAFDQSIQTQYNNYISQLQQYEKDLLAKHADKFRPGKAALAYETYRQAESEFNDGSYAEAKSTADSLIDGIKAFIVTFDEQLAEQNKLQKEVEQNISAAKKVHASIWAPAELNKALAAYNRGMGQFKNYQLDESIVSLSNAKDLCANLVSLSLERKKAYDIRKAREAEYNKYMVQFQRYQRKLEGMQAGKFRPKQTGKFYDEVNKAIELYKKGNYDEAKALADTVLAGLQKFTEKLDEEIRWAGILKRDTEQNLSRADKVEAFIWAPDELQKAMIAFNDGIEKYREFDLDGSIAALTDAKGYSLKAVRVSPQRKDEYQTQALQDEIQQEIEKASGMTIITEDGKVIEPKPWSGNGKPKTKDANDQTSLREISSDVAVLDDVSSQSLLDQAKELYALGVQEKEKGNYTKANEYFREAGRLTYKYKSMAVGEPTEIIIADKNTLWYLTDKEWGNAFLWPLIWRYNKDTVRDPDLIFPGEKLLIPAR